MEFRELSDEEWEIIRLLLPPKASVGRPRIDDKINIRKLDFYYLDYVELWRG
jgi:transposase